MESASLERQARDHDFRNRHDKLAPMRQALRGCLVVRPDRLVRVPDQGSAEIHVGGRRHVQKAAGDWGDLGLQARLGFDCAIPMVGRVGAVQQVFAEGRRVRLEQEVAMEVGVENCCPVEPLTASPWRARRQ